MSLRPDNSMGEWAKSSYSNGAGGECVEWKPEAAAAGAVPVRDSKDTGRSPLVFPAAAWTSFTTALQADTL